MPVGRCWPQKIAATVKTLGLSHFNLFATVSGEPQYSAPAGTAAR